MKYFLCVVGMVFILEGLPYFAFPEKIKIYLQKLQELQDSTLRAMGGAAVILGLFLVYLGTQ
jgi:hypothetical protein